MFKDLIEALRRPGLWLYTTWVQFLILYRRTALGPLWIILAPMAFIGLLGFLFTAISQTDASSFIPHLTVGFIIWTYMSEIVSSSSRLYVRYKSALMSGVTNHSIFHLRSIAKATIKILHQMILIIAVCVIYQIAPTSQLLLIVPAVTLLLIHAYWVSVLLSIVAARFRDIAEITELALRIGFLATPVIWMPAEGVRGSVIGSYLLYNPFYHVLEPVRSSILGTSYPYTSLAISSILAVIGLLTAHVFYSRYRKKAILWV